MTQWNHELVARIAGEIRRCRTEENLSAAKLSDRTAEVGMRITRSIIADLENGRKKTLDISELLVLAKALQVPPLQLVYPDLPDGQVEALPGMPVRSISAVLWAAGAQPFPEADFEAHNDADLRLRTTLLAKSLQLVQLEVQLEDAEGELRNASAENRDMLMRYRWQVSEQLRNQKIALGLEERTAEELAATRDRLTKAQARVDERKRRRQADKGEIDG